jgi:hypothetical protein
MKSAIHRSMASGLLAALLVLGAQHARAEEFYRLSGRYAIFIVVESADRALAREPAREAARMHGGPDLRHLTHHLQIVLFDASSGERIGDARVSAKVSATGSDPQEKRLDPMGLKGATSYGAYFRFRHETKYRVELAIAGRDDPTPASAAFEYAHGAGRLK